MTLTMQIHKQLFFHKNFCRKQKPHIHLEVRAHADVHVRNLRESIFENNDNQYFGRKINQEAEIKKKISQF